jgi:hypothetical protein
MRIAANRGNSHSTVMAYPCRQQIVNPVRILELN